MPPLILHNVPDEELYVGEDGVQRPYAMVFPGPDGHLGGSRGRKHAPETGAFGKSIRRSRSKTATPAKREDPTILAGDAIFSKYLSNLAATPSEVPQRKASLPSSAAQTSLSSQASALAPIDSNTTSSSRYVHKVPTEVILRGFQSSHQYAAIKHYETIAGRICEDYPRDPPPEHRRFKSDLRDPNSLRTHSLTSEEKAKALRFAGGENWIKVTFESAEAADVAIYSSPQTILGYVVYAEPYRGLPPTSDEAIPAIPVDRPTPRRAPLPSQSLGPSSASLTPQIDRRPSSTLPRSFMTPSMTRTNRNQQQSLSPPGSNSSSSTLDTATLSTATASSATVTSLAPSMSEPEGSAFPKVQDASSTYCQNIPTARRIRLLPADQALLPQPSHIQWLLSNIPLLAFFSTDIIGSEVPRQDNGEFDWARATLYWRICWWLDFWLSLFGGDVAGILEKDD